MLKGLLLCLVLFLPACFASDITSEFFAGDISSRVERLEKYPLDQQYKIFSYGNQVIHPPATGLAMPLAKRGKPALDYILNELDHSENDLDFRDSMVVFQMMQWGGHYNVCADTVAINKIRGNENKIHDAGWKDVYSQMLSGLCRKATK